MNLQVEVGGHAKTSKNDDRFAFGEPRDRLHFANPDDPKARTDSHFTNHDVTSDDSYEDVDVDAQGD